MLYILAANRNILLMELGLQLLGHEIARGGSDRRVHSLEQRHDRGAALALIALWSETTPASGRARADRTTVLTLRT